MAPGELTPRDVSSVESHSWVLVLPSPPPELGTLFQPDVPAPQVATATVKPRPVPRVLVKTQEYFKPSACQHKISYRAASLEEQRSLPTSPHGWEHSLPSPCQRGQRNRKASEKDNTGYKGRLGSGSGMMLPASAVGEARTILVCPFICCSAGAKCPKAHRGLLWSPGPPSCTPGSLRSALTRAVATSCCRRILVPQGLRGRGAGTDFFGYFNVRLGNQKPQLFPSGADEVHSTAGSSNRDRGESWLPQEPAKSWTFHKTPPPPSFANHLCLLRATGRGYFSPACSSVEGLASRLVMPQGEQTSPKLLCAMGTCALPLSCPIHHLPEETWHGLGLEQLRIAETHLWSSHLFPIYAP